MYEKKKSFYKQQLLAVEASNDYVDKQTWRQLDGQLLYVTATSVVEIKQLYL